MPDLKFGRLPNDPARPRVKLGPRLTGRLPARAANVDWMSKVNGWPMLGNDTVGDCTIAASGHIIEATSTYGHGSTENLTDEQALDAYSAVTGYDPTQTRDDGTNPTDTGASMQAVLEYWQNTGLGGHRILAFAEIDPNNQGEVDAALAIFGDLYVGMNLPKSAVTQFGSSQPWTVERDDGGIAGGHAIHVGAYQDNGTNLRATTWGKVQELDREWFSAYVEEAWVVITGEWLNAAGVDPDGVDLQGLGEDIQMLTGGMNPFPPQPSPPAPTPVDADAALATAARPWLSLHHVGPNKAMAKALATWVAAKNL